MVNLRPHHVGNLFYIYTKPYLSHGTFEQNLEKFGEGLYIRRYPFETMERVITLFSKILAGAEKIKIISGPDAICQSRCLMKLERELSAYKTIKLTREIKRKVSDIQYKLETCCYNNDFELDMFWQETLNLKLGRTYRWPELEKKFRGLREKFEKNYKTDAITEMLEQWRRKKREK
ncbi:MAG: hypothetical protein UX53_C0033G0011 [Candidatus Azambacteria bacterium GW2011_GWB2_46_37]|uniref:Uncharacterized protein n=4 Tax=Candidatus Azamiibacteriota TaxID=1752741 RepID=A0A0G1Q4Q4_9BACT|nr:MAG: hypothetical protein UX27_C0024G0003 [Candidatus Azambacteria bacterium GW2011_GWA2_45_90]KKU36359.1 MAG: hypothetical protein UX51_C0050G0010 [Candidatus Azambacteria bacterium GW2011_GWF2_46_32]KKU38253.1 MAG: hypothetical protein UX53_C0033G0011 [Candidatus Azambacteria bacterium GW2011_GWB2_46_37]KKU39964.1 MAG: hypothetical protein UX55_C0020G0007 [Candidatus Azambacteria bacterium GW2011_GWE2_46_45]HAM95680.1 hypothetical protein [Candidatus Azambacteria bacterium]